MFERRDLLRATVAGAALVALPRPAWPAATSDPAEAARLNTLLDEAYDWVADSDPEFCTAFGLDTGARAAAKARLTDRSPQGIRQQHDLYRRGLAGLDRIDATRLSGMDRINYDAFIDPWRLFVGAYDRFQYGLHSWPEPYSVSQLGGTYRSIPDFLANQHSIVDATDAEAYLSRVADFAVQLGHESDRLEAEHRIGVIAPDFVLDRTIALFATALKPAPEETVLVRTIAAKTKAMGIAGEWAARATALVRDRVNPALVRQKAVLEGVRPRAVHDAGVWRLPQGPDYYDYALQYATTTRMSADAIHKLGIDRMADLSAQADVILKAQGMTRGSVGARLRALNDDPRFLYPNTDAGKAKLIAELDAQMAAIQKRLPEMFGRLPKAKVEIRRVPPEIEAGATLGYYQPPTPDGARPGAYYVNLRDTAEVPRWTLPTLTYHEASPGHHMQLSLALEATGIPKIRRLPNYSVYTEGWGLYAEQVADEMGVYADDPFGRLGYLQSVMHRAARLVVDTGLHAKRWPLEQAVAYMDERLGMAKASVVTEAERYCVWPGQATSYMVGQTRWVALREKARKALGAKFDIRGFHDTALAAGAIPLSALENLVDGWIAERKSA